jgi:hypothetical protein
MNLIVPSTAETQLTGFILGAERDLRSVKYRAELWAGEPLPRMFKSGRQLSQLDASTTLVKLANELTRYFNQMIRANRRGPC